MTSRTPLKPLLDRLSRDFDYARYRMRDPISLPLRYSRPRDIECAAFIAACLSYGRISLFLPVIEAVLAPMKRSPYRFIRDLDPLHCRHLFGSLSYRFARPGDIAALLLCMQRVLRMYDSLEAAFQQGCPAGGSGSSAVKSAIEFLGRELALTDVSAIYDRPVMPPGLRHLLPSTSAQSASKRTCLFLRWMCRRGEPDFGLWQWPAAAELVIPLDTHIAKTARRMGLTARKSNDWRTAVEITHALQAYDAEDPLRYDFALCHATMNDLL